MGDFGGGAPVGMGGPGIDPRILNPGKTPGGTFGYAGGHAATHAEAIGPVGAVGAAGPAGPVGPAQAVAFHSGENLSPASLKGDHFQMENGPIVPASGIPFMNNESQAFNPAGRPPGGLFDVPA